MMGTAQQGSRFQHGGSGDGRISLPRRLARWAAILTVATMALVSGACHAQKQTALPLPGDVPWYNVQRPLTLKDLRGRAVLLDFFSPGCINCVHMLPVEDKLAAQFGTRLVVIGVDSPKFSGSKSRAALDGFIARHGITHPMILDRKLQLWNAYGVHAWPSFILIGPRGQAVAGFIGERSYSTFADAIKKVLAAAPPADKLPTLPLKAAAASTTPLSMPGGLAVSANDVAIADTGHNRIVLATHDGQVKAVIGDGCAGHEDGNASEARFNRPHGLAFHAGALYVADTKGNTIRRIGLEHDKTATIAGNGQRAYAPSGQHAPLQASLNSPWGLAWHAQQLYISMAGNHQIWRLNTSKHTLGPWAGTGAEGLRDGPIAVATFAQPSGLAVHGSTLYDADPESSSVRAITLAAGSNAKVRTLVGKALFQFGLKDGKAQEALLQHDEDVAWANGSLYIADTFNNAVRRLNLETQRVSTVAHVTRPIAIARLDATTLLVASGNGIKQIALASGKVMPWPVEPLSPPAAGRCND